MIKNKIQNIKNLRKKIKQKKCTIGSFLQINNSNTAEIVSSSGYEWIVLDMEHGLISHSNLPDMIRSIELYNALPIVRIGQNSEFECKKALDCGAAGLMLPMIQSADHLKEIMKYCYWPPEGQRGVGYSRANDFGKNFNLYKKKLSQSPIIIAMIENIDAVNNLEAILSIKGLDAIFIGPYDLSASIGVTGNFNNTKYKTTIKKILNTAKKYNVACGMHIVKPDVKELKIAIKIGFKFIAYSIDSVFLNTNCQLPKV